MKTTLTVALIVVAIILIWSILLMNPKHWGIGMGIGGTSSVTSGNEYGSRKTIESKLKVIALITAVLFVGICTFLPFVD